jgi:hypothetical protein
MGVLNKVCNRGDTKTKWNPDIPDEVELARHTFKMLKEKGYAAVDQNGKSIKTFDPSLGEITMVPDLQGG